jgi:hypothetical protein
MDLDDIFQAYYTLYRLEADTPASSDDEYTVALRLANEAVSYWSQYDGTYWKELFTTAQTNSTGGVVTITTGTKTYAAPTAMKEAGGFIKILDSSSNTFRQYPIIDAQEAQFRSDMGTYAYFTGNPAQGFTLHLNPSPDTAINGKSIDYVYYKKPTEFTTGTDKTEMTNPYFCVHRMLAMRFRGSRNPYYNSALRDAENAVKVMKMDNDSGSWANPWKVADNSGSIFGE